MTLEPSLYGDYAESKADMAAGREGTDKLTDATGEGLAAVAYALLDVAAAIRDHAEVMQAIHEDEG